MTLDRKIPDIIRLTEYKITIDAKIAFTEYSNIVYTSFDLPDVYEKLKIKSRIHISSARFAILCLNGLFIMWSIREITSKIIMKNSWLLLPMTVISIIIINMFFWNTTTISQNFLLFIYDECSKDNVSLWFSNLK